MEYIKSIAILDFNQKIFFFQKRPEEDFDSLWLATRNIAQSLKAQYINDFVKGECVIRLMDTIMSSTIKVKRMVDALYALCKTTKLKVDYLIKRYQDVNHILFDTIFFLNPRIRLSSKTEMTFAELDIQEHSIYFQIFCRAIPQLKSLVYFHSSKDYLKVRGEIVYKRNQNAKLINGKFLISRDLSKEFLLKKNELLKQFGVLTVIKNPYETTFRNRNAKVEYISGAKINSNKIGSDNLKNNDSKKKEENTMTKSNSSKLEKSTGANSESVSPEIITQKVKTVPYESNSIVFNDKKDDSNSKKDNTEEALKSLTKVNINDILSSINFDFDNNPIVIQASNEPNKNITQSTQENNDFFNMLPDNKVNDNPTKKPISFIDFTMPEIITSKNDCKNNAENKNKISKSNSLKIIKSDTVSQPALLSKFPHSPDLQHQSSDQDFNYPINNTASNTNLPTNFDIFSGPKAQSNKNLLTTPSSEAQMNFNNDSTNKNNNNLSINFESLNLTVNEDIFDSSQIKKQIRCSISEKGVLINNKGVYKEISYRGQLALELTSNFIIHNKTFTLKLAHPNWTDHTYFPKKITNNIVTEEGPSSYKINCRDIKTIQHLLEYSPNLKIIKPGAEFQVTGVLKNEKYKLELICQMNEDSHKKMRNSQMNIFIFTKTNDILIHKTNNQAYTIQDKKITYIIPDFTSGSKVNLGIMFKTTDPTFVQMVKVSYRYMDILPSSVDAELFYKDEHGNSNSLDVAKKCTVEISFTP